MRVTFHEKLLRTARGGVRRMAHARGWLTWLIALALLGAAMRAVFMPPWGLMDEAQHLHYVRHLAEHGEAPLAGRARLSQEIVDSLFATRRWELFRWETPLEHAPEQLGLVGHSYEGYHPPLYYALQVPLHRLLNAELLSELYALRLASVALSSLTLIFAALAAREAFGRRRTVVWLAVALLACSPERMHAVSRVNNDGLLEVWGALVTWLSVRISMRGTSASSSAALGLAFCAGVWTKISMVALAPLPAAVFLLRRRDRGALAHAALSALIVAAGVYPLIARNLELYGDWSGFAGFLAAVEGEWSGRALSLGSIASALYDTLTRPWVIWQRGMHEMRNPAVLLASAALAGVVLLAAIGALREAARGVDTARAIRMASAALWTGSATAIAALVFALHVGKIPLVNARFLAPFCVAICLTLARGLSLTRIGRALSAPLVLALFALTPLLLFASELQYFYWPRDVTAPLGALDTLTRYFENIAAGRPPFTVALMWTTPVLYAAALAWLARSFIWSRR